MAATSLAAPASVAAAPASHAPVIAIIRSDVPDARIESVHLLAGALPPGATAAMTLTDANCQPDRLGVSHCINELRLTDGTLLVIRHDHDMRAVPCLSPGERVSVQASK
ncbi:hypothetical protein EPN52_07570 [bacterium]|nr:MAG: hypothetical protein EPN52_07570 [bacterium]